MLLFVGYPLLPWVGVLLAGYAMGPTFLMTKSVQRSRFVALGCVGLLGFLFLRLVHGYGDPAPWTTQRTGLLTVASFLHCTKYPPSLQFLLMTLGPMFLCLAFLQDSEQPWHRPFRIFGRTPLFFYLLHIPFVHLVGVGMSLWKYGRAEWWFKNPPFPGRPEDYGWGLPTLYLWWVVTLIVLLPVCRWYRSIVTGRVGR